MNLTSHSFCKPLVASGLLALNLIWLSPTFAWTTVESGLTNPKEGKVVDTQTGQPIAGAWVVVHWSHGGFNWVVEGSSQSGCMYSLTVRTDDNGIYHIPEVSKEVEVEREWTLLSKDGYGWSLITFAPGYINSADIPPWLTQKNDRLSGEEIEYLSRSFSPHKWEHPKVLSGGWFGSLQTLEPVKLELSKVPPEVEVGYLNEFKSAMECQDKRELAPLRALYERAYQVACVDTPDYTGAEWVDRLWRYVTPLSEERKRREKEISSINDKGRAQRDREHYFLLTQDDRKALCELTAPIEGIQP